MSERTSTILLEDTEAEFEIATCSSDLLTIRFIFEAGCILSATISRSDATKIGYALIDGFPDDDDTDERTT